MSNTHIIRNIIRTKYGYKFDNEDNFTSRKHDLRHLYKMIGCFPIIDRTDLLHYHNTDTGINTNNTVIQSNYCSYITCPQVMDRTCNIVSQGDHNSNYEHMITNISMDLLTYSIMIDNDTIVLSNVNAIDSNNSNDLHNSSHSSSSSPTSTESWHIISEFDYQVFDVPPDSSKKPTISNIINNTKMYKIA